MTTPSETELFKRFASDPAYWCQQVLGTQPWSKQVEIQEAVRDHREVAVKSCNSAGKSWNAAAIVLWFLGTHVPSIVITTAPTDRQVRFILWQEIRRAHSQAKRKLGGAPLLQELHLDTGWYALGFAASDYDESRFQGFHSDNILVVVDEASGVSEQVFEGVDSLMAGGNAKLLMIGNPTDPASHFAKAFRMAEVKKITVSAYDTPNFTTTGIKEEHIADGSWKTMVPDPLPSPHLVNPQWVAERWIRWGPSNPMYISRVKGQFPEQSTDSLIPYADIEAAQARTLDPVGVNELGVDVARMGPDETVIYLRKGPVVRLIHSSRKQDTMATSGHVIRALKETGASTAHVDADGLGAGVVDRLIELNYPIIPIHGGQAAYDNEKFLNKRAEWYWGLRERFECGEIDIDIEDDELAAQLASLKWKLNSMGKIQIERKDEMKKRGLPSPDRADALAYCCAVPDRPFGDYGITV